MMKRYKIGDVVIFTEEAFIELSIKTNNSFTIKEILNDKDNYNRDIVILDKAIITKNGVKLANTFSSKWIEIDKKYYRLKKLKNIIEDEN